jgi:hypothetical protein
MLGNIPRESDLTVAPTQQPRVGEDDLVDAGYPSSFLASTAAGLGAAAATPQQPNLVYVFADQLRCQPWGYAGDEYARTPNIDRLAAQSCNFHQAIP